MDSSATLARQPAAAAFKAATCSAILCFQESLSRQELAKLARLRQVEATNSGRPAVLVV